MGLEQYGRYEALHRLASGGMASVFVGRARGPGGFERLVAIKVMHEHIAHDPDFSGMFLDEARLAARIRHPNVVPTLDVAEDGHYIVMEYVEGASLHAILRRLRDEGQRLPLRLALRIFVDTLAGLHAAHELDDHRGKPLNIVHRDVSPHNILVGVDGQARITDFGIAYAEARITSTRGGELKGKLPYMAPEQLEDRGVDRRTDVYAAGCVLWEMLVGRRLFRGGSEAAIACAILAGPERSPRQEREEVPESIDAACMQALRGLDARFTTALAFSEAIERAADAEGIRLARHRDVGEFAKKTALTFPAPASLVSDGALAAAAEEPPPATAEAIPPMPPTVPVGKGSQHDAPPVTLPTRVPDTAEPATFPSGAPSEAAPTLRADALEAQHDEEEVPNRRTLASLDDIPVGARTTTEDRPPPDVAAVISAEIERQRVQDDRPSHDAIADTGLTASSDLVPKTKGSGWIALVAIAAVGIAVAVGATLGGDDEPKPATTAETAAPTSEAAPSATETAEPSPSVVPTTTAAADVAPPAQPAPKPLAKPVTGTTRPTPGPLPKPPPPAPPSPASTGYHPATP